jgi:hypoxanthine phosphoribosyltransferase
MTPHRFPNSTTEYVAPSWVELHELAFDLTNSIRASGQQFDRLITLSKGGWPMSVALVDFLKIKAVASIGVKFYAGIGQTLAQPMIYQSLPDSVKGERVLLFDDVADTGGSLTFTVEQLKKQGVASVTTAALLKKPTSSFIPDFYAAETDAWIIFPWEVADAIETLGGSWQKEQISEVEIMSRLKSLGFADHWTQTFLPRRS